MVYQKFYHIYTGLRFVYDHHQWQTRLPFHTDISEISDISQISQNSQIRKIIEFSQIN